MFLPDYNVSIVLGFTGENSRSHFYTLVSGWCLFSLPRHHHQLKAPKGRDYEFIY